MSGIVGIFCRDGRPVHTSELQAMIDMLAHRGPDGAAIWCEGSVGLGHRMLHTTPESLHETLPWTNERGDLTITADARIDNRDELFNLLRPGDGHSGEIADSQLILAAYQKWGERCPEYLLGDFAFAVWDSREQQLFCARDHFGVRPFYYYLDDDVFVFASEIKALLCVPEVPQQLSELMLARHLHPVFDDPEATIYEGIRRLISAHSALVTTKGQQQRRYWALDPTRETILPTDEAYASSFRELFTDAVRARLRSVFPVGSMLSGGLDSSSVTCVAERILSEEGKCPLATFSAVFDNVAKSDERTYIEQVLEMGQFDAHYFQADAAGPLSDLDEMLWHQDGPYNSGNLYINTGIYKRAIRHEIRVILDGFDGDTTVSHGAGKLLALANNERWIALAYELKAYTERMNGPSWPVIFGRYAYYKYPKLKRIRRRLQRVIQRLNRERTSVTPPVDTVLRQKHLQRVKLATQNGAPHRPKTEREEHYRLLMRDVMVSTLEVLNKAAGAHAIEVRFPFFDRRLVEFCLSLPAEQKLFRGWSRIVLRRAMAGILPEAVRWRVEKSDMAFGFDFGLQRQSDKLHNVAESLADQDALLYIDEVAWQQLYERFSSEQRRKEDGLNIWRALALSRWLQQRAVQS